MASSFGQRYPTVVPSAEVLDVLNELNRNSPDKLLNETFTVRETGDIIKVVLLGTTYYVVSEEYILPLSFTAANCLPFAATEAAAFTWRLPKDSACMVTAWNTITTVATTSETGKYWTILLKKFSNTFVGANLISYNTEGDTPDIPTLHEPSVGDFTNHPTTAGDVYLQASITKTSTPGALTVYPSLKVRNIFGTLT